MDHGKWFLATLICCVGGTLQSTWIGFSIWFFMSLTCCVMTFSYGLHEKTNDDR